MAPVPEVEHSSMKDRANAAFKSGDLLKAKEFYTLALNESHSDAVIWCNQAATHLALGCPHFAAADAIRSSSLNSSYAKAYFRLGSAFSTMSGFKHATQNFETCLRLGQDTLVVKKLQEARKQLEKSPTELQSKWGRAFSSFYCPPETCRDVTNAEDLHQLNQLCGLEAPTRSVQIRPCEDHGGLGLFSQEDVLANGNLLLEEKPILAISLDPSRCVMCTESLNDDCISCEHCLAERYCSEECRKSAWDRYHRAQCGPVAKELAAFRTEMHGRVQNGEDDEQSAKHCRMLAAARIIGILKTSEFSGAFSSHPEFCNLHSLTDNKESEIREQVHHPFKRQYLQWKLLADMVRLDGSDLVRFDFEFYDTLWHILSGNLFKMDHAYVLARSASFANHSCSANAEMQLTKGRVTLRSLTALSKDDEVVISYIESSLPRTQRRKLLLESYWFTCRCSLCEECGESDVGQETSDDWLHEAARMMPMLEVMMKSSPGEKDLVAIIQKYGWDGKEFSSIRGKSREEFESDFRSAFVTAGFDACL